MRTRCRGVHGPWRCVRGGPPRPAPVPPRAVPSRTVRVPRGWRHWRGPPGRRHCAPPHPTRTGWRRPRSGSTPRAGHTDHRQGGWPARPTAR
ncbi:hypothetical protein ACFFX0_28925 [Citricoccus parietis]|uniref:Uncharacterized protein n=1 Tax=Citricoccus parietis TaxID=592307 RepID=A0ABV5G7X6_9MICC